MTRHQTSWLNDSGGLRYHVRGWRAASSLWRPFRIEIVSWLREWEPEAKTLVIAGPSAGWCLDRDWLARFDKLVCVDPDPVARLLFKARMRHRRCEWVREDFLSYDPPAGSAVLFANILGQVKLLAGEDNESELLSRWKGKVSALRGQHAWASFHDRVSGALEPSLKGHLRVRERLSDGDVVARCYPKGVKGELFDHETEGFFEPGRQHSYFSWQLAPGAWHLIEATASRK